MRVGPGRLGRAFGPQSQLMITTKARDGARGPPLAARMTYIELLANCTSGKKVTATSISLS